MTEPTAEQKIVKILSGKGNYLHEAELPDKTKFLISMPSKFRRNVWIKNGDFVIVDPIKEGNKVKGEISKVLTKDYIKYLRTANCWPEEFDEVKNEVSNRPPIEDSYSSSSSSDSE
ncbi:unnamed protein product [Bemisia tabaci]|uniref:Probable RNA-binding protein EIF1AD n=2 Tax=Bemisia tabaci TaxID=7038 RepID=A0A9P0F2V5_BEMTA|nr:unnamed protein product [Bemisia tabaci]